MKFTSKVFFSTIIVIALAMGFGGYYLLNATFNAAINRETRQALDDSGILSFAIETVSLNYPLKYDNIQDQTIGGIASTLEAGRTIRISDDHYQTLYEGAYFTGVGGLRTVINQDMRACQILEQDKRYFVYTVLTFQSADRLLYLETLKDITMIFAERDTGFALHRNITIVTLIVSALIMYVVAVWLTRPITALTNVTRVVAAGDYSQRAKKITSDELGLLTDDFNKMADALQGKINELSEEAQAQERFVAAFSHELKTPLTAVIGYADLLRSRKLDGEELFLSADYVYKEGKRLEELSLRLLDIIVLKKNVLHFKDTPVSLIFDLIKRTFSSNGGLLVSYDEALIQTEASLLTSVLYNMVDNALKSTEGKGMVRVRGELIEGGYRFRVQDDGCGIAQQDIKKLTQAFYMVDKSRTRKSGGAGLGLTLCAQILAIHHSSLEIESTIGEGTTVSFVLPLQKKGGGDA